MWYNNSSLYLVKNIHWRLGKTGRRSTFRRQINPYAVISKFNCWNIWKCFESWIAWKVSKYEVFSSPYLVRLQENTDQKQLRIWTFLSSDGVNYNKRIRKLYRKLIWKFSATLNWKHETKESKAANHCCKALHLRFWGDSGHPSE